MSQPWHDDARRLVEGGLSPLKAGKALGKSEHAVRFALNINGCREKTKARVNKLRAERRARGYTERRQQERPVPRVNQVVKTCGDTVLQPSIMVISLPKISLSPIDEPKPARRFAPRTRWSSKPGVDRIRAIHRKMIRDGRVPASDLVSEWRQ